MRLRLQSHLLTHDAARLVRTAPYRGLRDDVQSSKLETCESTLSQPERVRGGVLVWSKRSRGTESGEFPCF